MNKSIQSVLLAICISLSCISLCWGITITEPADGAVFHPGDKVVVKVQTTLDEKLQGMWVYATKMPKSTLLFVPPYVFEFTIPPTFTGADTIVAVGKLLNNSVIESQVRIRIALPTSVTLQRMQASPNPLFLYKIRADNSPDDIKVFETKSLSVGGVYSDGVKREITSPTTGTTYTTSDEKIAVVDTDGLVTAVGVGTAKITVKNGDKTLVIDVVVKAKKR